MTKFLQSRSSHIIVKCILGIIVLSLIFSTMTSYINQDFEKYIATVNGEKISFDLFNKMYFIEREKQKKILGKKFFELSTDKKFIKKTYNYIISKLINNILLEQYVEKMNLQVSDQKIKQMILNSPVFSINNKFNKEKYFNYLTSINLTNQEYINIIKRKVNTENFIRTISNTNFILEEEKNNIIKLLSQKRIIQKSIIKIDSLVKKQNITNIEAKNYFNKNKNNFYVPEEFKVSFVKLTLDQFKTNCKDKEIQDWYIKNIKKYSVKEKRRYSIIQTKNKIEAELILSELHKKPENFSKIAKEKSIDPISSKKGGDLGWMSIHLIPNQIKNSNLNKKNEISKILPYYNEFLIIKLNDIQEEKQKTIDEVSNIIKNEIKYKKSLILYNEFKEKISSIIKKNPNQIELMLKEKNISFNETHWFNKNSIPKILDVPIIKKIIFHKELFLKNNTFKPYLNFIVLKKNKSFLIKIKDFKNKKIQNFENAKEKIIKKLKFIKANNEIKIKSKAIINELKKGKNNLFKKYNLYFNNSEIVSRYDTNPITSVIFSLPHPEARKKIYTLYQDENKDCIIILLKKVYNTNFSSEEKRIIFEYLEKNNTEIIFNCILKNLWEKAIIKYEKIKIT